MSADLHCHSKYSDGSVCVEELVMLAKNRGLSAVAVTDHDTFLGSYNAKPIGERLGVNIITGAEISCRDKQRGRKVHLLCYLPKNTEKLDKMLEKTLLSRREAMRCSIEKIMELYPIPYELIERHCKGSTSLYKQHVMHALMDAGYADEIFGSVFRSLFDSKIGIAKRKTEQPDVFEALKLVRESGGIAVLAHPNVYNSYDIIPELIKNGLDGIEVRYPRAKPSDDAVLTEICREYNLLTTGGTDFHGINTTKVNPIGTCTTTDKEIESLLELSEKKKIKGS